MENLKMDDYDVDITEEKIDPCLNRRTDRRFRGRVAKNGFVVWESNIYDFAYDAYADAQEWLMDLYINSVKDN
tara:strand:- start:2054 stop:2272 length:219 start_codon:yes stop_codon:yes gene_type:complete